jgi:hypothetical protein
MDHQVPNLTENVTTRIPSTRDIVPAPEQLVINGKVNWGTFATALSKVNLLDSRNPLGYWVPAFFKKKRLKEWQAFQIDSDAFFILGAVYQTGLVAINIISVWDKAENTLKTWQSYAKASSLVMADNLLESVNSLKTKDSQIEIHNQLGKGICEIKGQFKATQTTPEVIEFNWQLESCSEPSVVSMPLGSNRGLYTHKEVFKAMGQIKVGSRVYECQPNDYAIIDDHKGFYPYHLHYDWVTGIQHMEKGEFLAFNLTKNQAVFPEHYNENWLWVNGKRLPLPTVSFQHESDKVWRITDEQGYVDLTMQIDQNLHMNQNFIVASVNYRAVYGAFNGIIKDQAGNSYRFENACGMGEDKTYRI